MTKSFQNLNSVKMYHRTWKSTLTLVLSNLIILKSFFSINFRRSNRTREVRFDWMNCPWEANRDHKLACNVCRQKTLENNFYKSAFYIRLRLRLVYSVRSSKNGPFTASFKHIFFHHFDSSSMELFRRIFFFCQVQIGCR